MVVAADLRIVPRNEVGTAIVGIDFPLVVLIVVNAVLMLADEVVIVPMLFVETKVLAKVATPVLGCFHSFYSLIHDDTSRVYYTYCTKLNAKCKVFGIFCARAYFLKAIKTAL